MLFRSPHPRRLWVTGQARPVSGLFLATESCQKFRPCSLLLPEALHVGAAICILVFQITASSTSVPCQLGQSRCFWFHSAAFFPEAGQLFQRPVWEGLPPSKVHGRRDQHSESPHVCSQHASLLDVLEAGMCSQGWPCPPPPSAALLEASSKATCCQDKNALRSL